MIKKKIKLNGVSPQLIDQIYIFESLNDLEFETDVDNLKSTQKAKGASLAHLISIKQAEEKSDNLRVKLEQSFKDMIKKYGRYDAKQMIKKHKESKKSKS